jgi:hypothetical protein
MSESNPVIDASAIRIHGGAMLQFRRRNGQVETFQVTEAEARRLLRELAKEFGQ